MNIPGQFCCLALSVLSYLAKGSWGAEHTQSLEILANVWHIGGPSVVQIYVSTGESEVGRSWVQEQPGIPSETLTD